MAESVQERLQEGLNKNRKKGRKAMGWKGNNRKGNKNRQKERNAMDGKVIIGRGEQKQIERKKCNG